jgi:hypothetical protein
MRRSQLVGRNRFGDPLASVEAQIYPGNRANPDGSIVESKSQLHKDFARIQKMCPAESKTVVQQYAPVSDIHALYVDREFLPKVLPKRQIERRMRLEMVVRVRRRIAVCESRRVINVG